ncbi:SufD family Fe-S cluster assembly protein [Lactobacillaceae bacterium Melli_B4]
MSIIEFAKRNQEPEWLQVKRQVVSEIVTRLPINDEQNEYQFVPPMLTNHPLNVENQASGTLKQNGGIIMDLFAAAHHYPNFIQENLMEKAIEWRKNALNARHLSYLQSGGFVYIPPNIIIDEPIDLSPLIDHQVQEKHLLIIVGADSRVDFKFIDQDVQLQNDCLMVEILLGDHASVQYFDEVRSNADHHHRILNAYLAQHAQLSTYVGLLNHGDLRYESNLSLDGQNSTGKINLVSKAIQTQRQSVYTSTASEGPDTHGEINGYGFVNNDATMAFISTGTIHEASFGSNFQQHNQLFQVGDECQGKIDPKLIIDNPDSNQEQHNQVDSINDQQVAAYLKQVDQALSTKLNDGAVAWFRSRILNQIEGLK